MSLSNISSTRLTGWIVLLLGLIAAIFLGSAIGGSDLRLVYIALAVLPVVLVLVQLKINIWVLIPLGWYLTGRLGFLPLPLTVRDLCMLVAAFAFTIFFALRIVPIKRKLNVIDYLIYINLGYLITVYARNPAGLYAFGADIVGGRPYFDVVVAFVAYMILSRVTPGNFIARIFPLLIVIPTTMVAILDTISRFVPSLAPAIAFGYSGAASVTEASAVVDQSAASENRITSFQFVGQLGGLSVCSYYRPITLLSPFYLRRMFLLLLVLIAIALSGHRVALVDFGAFFMLGSILRRKATDLWIAAGVAILVIIVAINVQGTMFQLPKTAQRALSILPGDWDPEAVEDAESTTRWRVDMWKWAWEDNRILRNKIWGQGFGVSADDMNIIANSIAAGTGFGDAFVGGSQQEWFLLYGGFHNGPLSAIRCVGGVGLFLFMLLMFRLAINAWRLSKRAFGSGAFALVLFASMPLIYEPFKFLLIFGGFEAALPNALFGAGLLNMVTNYFEACTRKNGVLLDKGRIQPAAGSQMQTSLMPRLPGAKH